LLSWKSPLPNPHIISCLLTNNTMLIARICPLRHFSLNTEQQYEGKRNWIDNYSATDTVTSSSQYFPNVFVCETILVLKNSEIISHLNNMVLNFVVVCAGVPSAWVKQLEWENNHSSPCSAKVTDAWSFTFCSTHVITMSCLSTRAVSSLFTCTSITLMAVSHNKSTRQEVIRCFRIYSCMYTVQASSAPAYSELLCCLLIHITH